MPQLTDRIVHIRSDMGTTVRVTAVFTTDADANAYLAQHPNEGVIAAAGGMVWIANNRDLAVPRTSLTLYFIGDNTEPENNRDLFAWAGTHAEALAYWQTYYDTTDTPESIGPINTANPKAGALQWHMIPRIRFLTETTNPESHG